MCPHEDQDHSDQHLREYPALCRPAIWDQGWTKDGASEEEDDGDPPSNTTLQRRIRAEAMIAPGVNPGAAEDAVFSQYKPETGFGCALFDARNGFN